MCSSGMDDLPIQVKVRFGDGEVIHLPTGLVCRIPVFASAWSFNNTADKFRLLDEVNAADLGVSKAMLILALHKIRPVLSGLEEHALCEMLGLARLDSISASGADGPGISRTPSAAAANTHHHQREGEACNNASAIDADVGTVAPSLRECLGEAAGDDIAGSKSAWKSIYHLLDFMGLDAGSLAFRETYFEADFSDGSLLDLHDEDGVPTVTPKCRYLSESGDGSSQWSSGLPAGFFPNDVIVLPPPRRCIPRLQDLHLSSRVDAMHFLGPWVVPAMNRVNSHLQGAGSSWVLAGGSVFNALLRCTVATDYDLFLVLEASGGEARPSSERVSQAIHALHAALTSLDAPLHLIQRSANALTFYLHTGDDDDTQYLPLQAIGWYASISAIISSFDIGSCQVAFDGERFLASRKGLASLETMCNVVNLNDISPQYVYRLGKYLYRGVGIVVPTSCQAALVNPDPAWDAYKTYILSAKRVGPYTDWVESEHSRQSKHAVYVSKTSILERIVNMARAAICYRITDAGHTLKEPAHEYEVVGNRYNDAIAMTSGGGRQLTSVHGHLFHLQVLRSRGLEPSFYLAEDLGDVLDPGPAGTLRFPRAHLANFIEEQDMYVPHVLREPFEMVDRTGKGSFQKRAPGDVLSDGQWFFKLGIELDATLRSLLGLPEIEEDRRCRKGSLTEVIDRLRAPSWGPLFAG